MKYILTRGVPFKVYDSLEETTEYIKELSEKQIEWWRTEYKGNDPQWFFERSDAKEHQGFRYWRINWGSSLYSGVMEGTLIIEVPE